MDWIGLEVGPGGPQTSSIWYDFVWFQGCWSRWKVAGMWRYSKPSQKDSQILQFKEFSIFLWNKLTNCPIKKKIHQIGDIWPANRTKHNVALWQRRIHSRHDRRWEKNYHSCQNFSQFIWWQNFSVYLTKLNQTKLCIWEYFPNKPIFFITF